MASSMTGLGFGEVQKDGKTIGVEIKSVNNRFLEISCRMPSILSRYEQKVREIIKSRIHRGKLYVTISVQGENEEVLDIRIDSEKARGIRHLLDDLCRVTGIQQDLHLEHFLNFSEIFDTLRESEGEERTWEITQEALLKALTDLIEMRNKEGEALTQDIVERVRDLEKNVAKIERHAKENVSDTHKKMVNRVRQLARDCEVDEERLYSEIVLMADKLDVTEECVRLRSHNRLFFHILDEEAVVGKKLNFLLQEINRETNTISSKAANAEISHIVVRMKEEIEKLREQVQNLE